MKTNQTTESRFLLKKRTASTLGLAALLLALPVGAQEQPEQNVGPGDVTNATPPMVGDDAKVLPGTTGVLTPQSEMELLRQQLKAMQDRLEALEGAQKTTDATVAKVAAPSVKSKLPVSISGLMQMQYNAFLSDDRGAANSPNGNANGFRIRRSEIKLQAQINDRLSATVMFDPISSTNTRNLQDLKLSYLVSKSANSSHVFDIGQFKIPVGYEGDLVSSSALQTVERALFYRNGDPVGGRGFDQREKGAMLSGNTGAISYWLGAFDGLGEDQNQTASKSDNVALIGRLAYTPRTSGLTLGVSGAVSNPRNVTPAGAPAGTRTRVDRNLMGLFAVYNNDRITAQAEYATGDSDIAAVPGIAAATVDRKGYYGSLGYRFTKKLEGVLRYDVYDPNTNVGNNSVSESTLGLNYYIKGNNAKIQLNLVDGGADAPNSDFKQVRSNFQLAF